MLPSPRRHGDTEKGRRGFVWAFQALAVLVSGGAVVYFLACYLVGLRVSELRMKPLA